MVEVKSITVGQYHFAGIYINLPQYPCLSNSYSFCGPSFNKGRLVT